MKQITKNRYENKNWVIEFGNRFSFQVWPKNYKGNYDQVRGGVYYYTGTVDILSGNKLPRPILNTLIQICRERHKQGLMPNRR